MLKKILFCALASAAMIPVAASAQHGGGNGGGAGGPPAGVGGPSNAGGFGAGGPNGMGDGGMSNGSMGGISDVGSSMRDQGRLNSQGPAHASQTGIDHANANSVLAGTTPTKTVTSGPLTGLTAGTVLYSNGAAVGTVQQIRTTGNGSVALVIVKGTDGGLYPVPASKLTFTGGVLSTTARLAGVNGRAPTTNPAIGISQGPAHASPVGIAHANPHSVLSGASGTTLTGVSVGMPLLSNGTQVGTVSRVVTANGVITRVLVQGTNGRIYSLAPSGLSASGGVLTTTATLHGM